MTAAGVSRLVHVISDYIQNRRNPLLHLRFRRLPDSLCPMTLLLGRSSQQYAQVMGPEDQLLGRRPSRPKNH